MISSSEILKASILIVDDQEANVTLLEQMLRGAGYVSVTSTSDPRAVCELHRKNRYSLIVLDLLMPGLDGFQVMAGLKEIETNGYLPVLVITAQPDHKLRALKAGAKDFVSKPFDLQEVLMRVHNLLEVRLLHLESELRTKHAENREQALRASELSYRRLFEAAKDGILILDADTGGITDVNPFLLKMLGFSHSEMVGKSIWEISPFKDIVSNIAKFVQLQQQGYVRYENLPLESRDGRRHAVEFVSNVYRAGDCNIVQCIIRDITERKRAEEELVGAKNEISRQAAALEETVTERTAQLRETIGELEAFSYSVSHDMRAPLRAMRGFSKILLERHAAQLDAEGIKYLENIYGAAGRMDTLIQDVLTYTRVLRAEVKTEPVDLDILVRQIIGIYPQLQTGAAEIQIEGVLPKVLGGEASLAQCISNLLTNAVTFVAPGTKPRVKVRAEAIAADIRLWVEDNGIGIAPQDQVRIFRMFERVGRDAAYKGTGMGLAIVRKAVERMGGQFGVESEAGQGSRFWIQLKGAVDYLSGSGEYADRERFPLPCLTLLDLKLPQALGFLREDPARRTSPSLP